MLASRRSTVVSDLQFRESLFDFLQSTVSALIIRDRDIILLGGYLTRTTSRPRSGTNRRILTHIGCLSHIVDDSRRIGLHESRDLLIRQFLGSSGNIQTWSLDLTHLINRIGYNVRQWLHRSRHIDTVILQGDRIQITTLNLGIVRRTIRTSFHDRDKTLSIISRFSAFLYHLITWHATLDSLTYDLQSWILSANLS